MIFLDATVMGLGLSMDAVAVSMANGLVEPKMRVRKVLSIAFAFGIFQGVMPVIGYFLGTLLSNVLTNAIPYIAFALLTILGVKMIADGVKQHKSNADPKPLTVKTLLVQAVATSIDALTVGVLYVDHGVSTAMICFSIIAVITFALSIAAVYLGKLFGVKFAAPAQYIGGAILIVIGLKILIEYLITVF